MLENIILFTELKPYIDRYSKINDYFTNKKPKFGDRILQMSAAMDGNGGVVTHQTSGEEYIEYIRNQVEKLPPHLRSNVEKNILTAQYFDKVYQEFLGSFEGQEYIKHLKMYGNGKPNPGSIDDIFVNNAGEGLVAATMPDHARSNIILNADYIDKYVRMMQNETGKDYDFILKKILVHEVNHYHGQPRKVRHWPKNEVEFHNDYSLVRFYVDLAKKHPENSDEYIDSAKFFTLRYGGKYRKTMDSYINKYSLKKKLNKKSVETRTEYAEYAEAA